MKIHCLNLVKNEADIIAYTLEKTLVWADYIYVYDNGSTDRTWEIVQEMSKKHKQIVPYKQTVEPFHDGLRGLAFRHYRRQAKEGDWFCLLDADEIYIDNPRIFLSKVPQWYQGVWGNFFQYYFTDNDYQSYKQQTTDSWNDIPIEKRLRYYKNNFRELRFFRYSEKLVWTKEKAYPSNLGYVYPVYIWIKHFQYRSPLQIEKRINLRVLAYNEAKRQFNKVVFPHEMEFNVDGIPSSGKDDKNKNSPNWQERIVPASTLHYDNLDERYILPNTRIRTPPSHLRVFVKNIYHSLKTKISNMRNRKTVSC